MIELNLQTNSPEQEALKQYLQENASRLLADKINQGVAVEIDSKVLINKKSLDGFMNYACEEAKKLAEKGAKFACIQSDTVFGLAIHYFEEDSISGSLFNSDGTEYKREPKAVPRKEMLVAIERKAKLDSCQLSLFDTKDPEEETDNDDNLVEIVSEDGEIIDNEDIDENINESVAEETEMKVILKLVSLFENKVEVKR